MMKYLATCTLLFLSTTNLFAADYFVSPSGNDASSGTFMSPWQTIQKAADTMLPGDTCYIRGGTYREAVTPSRSGSPGKPITFTVYSDERATISGCEPVLSNWTIDEGLTYKTSLTMELGHENQVFINRTNMAWEARWPNVGTTSLDGLLEYPMATMESGTKNTRIVDDAIPDYDWTGGKAWVSSHKRWFSWTAPITRFSRGGVSVADNSDGFNMVCREKGKFYLFGVRDALDSANEWHYDSSQKPLYLWDPGSGIPSEVEVKTRLYGFDLSDRQHIRIEKLRFFATSIKTSPTSASLEFDRLRMKHVYHSNTADKKYGSQGVTGFLLRGDNHALMNSEIAYSSGTGVYIGGSGHRVINNYIHDHDYIGSYASPLVVDGSDVVISHNTITRAGRQTVQFRKIYGSLFQFNDVSHAGYLTWDLGLIYGNGVAGGNAEVRYNWLHDNHSTHYGNGLYYDHGFKNILTHHNVIWNVNHKALNHNQYGNYLLWYNNTGSTRGKIGLGSTWNGGMKRDLHGCRYINNVVNAGTTFNGSDYVAENNFVHYAQLISNRHLTAESAPVDAAIQLAGITTPWIGEGPDAGAYEEGATPWVAGHDFTSPPTGVDTNRVLAWHRNLLNNATFAAGTLEPWKSMGGSVKLFKGNRGSQWIANKPTLMDYYSCELGLGQSGVSQKITGLKPDSEYELMAKFRVEPGESVYLGVKNHGYAASTGSIITNTITGAVPVRERGTPDEWGKTTLMFRTGTNATSAEVYAWKNSNGPGKVYLEDAGVQLQSHGMDAAHLDNTGGVLDRNGDAGVAQ